MGLSPYLSVKRPSVYWKELKMCWRQQKIDHDIVSNNVEVVESFPSEDLVKNLMSLDIRSGDLPAQQSLGLAWNINFDSFTNRIGFP